MYQKMSIDITLVYLKITVIGEGRRKDFDSREVRKKKLSTTDGYIYAF